MYAAKGVPLALVLILGYTEVDASLLFVESAKKYASASSVSKQ